MQINGINSAIPFKAQVESTSPLVSGNWAFLQEPQSTQNPQNTPTVNKPKSHWFRNTVLTLVAIAAIGGALIYGKNTDAVKKAIEAGDAATFGQKILKGIGKAGDWAQAAFNGIKGIFVKNKA